MSSNVMMILVVGGLIILMLLTQIRKIVALLIALLIAFGAGWYWPKAGAAGAAAPGMDVVKAQTCVSTF